MLGFGERRAPGCASIASRLVRVKFIIPVVAASLLMVAVPVPKPSGATSSEHVRAAARPRGAALTAPRIHDATGASRASRFAKYETSARITPRPANPFDPAQIDVRGIFVDARGRRFVSIGFWYQRYERALVGGYEHLTPVGDPGWRVRFSAPHKGMWTWWWEVSTPAGDARSARHTLSVVGSSDPGFV